MSNSYLQLSEFQNYRDCGNVKIAVPDLDNPPKGKRQPDLDLDVFLIRPFDPSSKPLQNGRPDLVLPAGDLLFLAKHTCEGTGKC